MRTAISLFAVAGMTLAHGQHEHEPTHKVAVGKIMNFGESVFNQGKKYAPKVRGGLVRAGEFSLRQGRRYAPKLRNGLFRAGEFGLNQGKKYAPKVRKGLFSAGEVVLRHGKKHAPMVRGGLYNVGEALKNIKRREGTLILLKKRNGEQSVRKNRRAARRNGEAVARRNRKTSAARKRLHKHLHGEHSHKLLINKSLLSYGEGTNYKKIWGKLKNKLTQAGEDAYTYGKNLKNKVYSGVRKIHNHGELSLLKLRNINGEQVLKNIKMRLGGAVRGGESVLKGLKKRAGAALRSGEQALKNLKRREGTLILLKKRSGEQAVRKNRRATRRNGESAVRRNRRTSAVRRNGEQSVRRNRNTSTLALLKKNGEQAVRRNRNTRRTTRRNGESAVRRNGRIAPTKSNRTRLNRNGEQTARNTRKTSSLALLKLRKFNGEQALKGLKKRAGGAVRGGEQLLKKLTKKKSTLALLKKNGEQSVRKNRRASRRNGESSQKKNRLNRRQNRRNSGETGAKKTNKRAAMGLYELSSLLNLNDA